MPGSFTLWFGVCFVCYLLRTTFNVLRLRERAIGESRVLVVVVSLIMFILWFSWAQMCFKDTVIVEVPPWLQWLGLLLFVAGVALFVISHVGLGGVRERGHVIKGGIYSRIRNPMYLGFSIWVIGFPLFLQRARALASAVLWIVQFLVWKTTEERELMAKYPEYREYRERTWF